MLNKIQSQVEAKLSPGDHAAYRKIVVAGMKVMFDDATFGEVMRQFNPERPAASLANGIIGLGVLLFRKSKNTMPIAPAIAGLNTLMLHAIDFLDKAGKLRATPELVGEATSIYLETIMTKMGMTKEKMAGIIQQTQQTAMQSKGAS